MSKNPQYVAAITDTEEQLNAQEYKLCKNVDELIEFLADRLLEEWGEELPDDEMEALGEGTSELEIGETYLQSAVLDEEGDEVDVLITIIRVA